MNKYSYVSYLYVALGGALGSILRVYLGAKFPDHLFAIPLQILIVNILGCYVMGVFAEFFGVHYPANAYLRLFLFSGLLGGFTTFSAFSLEFGLLWQKGCHWSAIVYSLLSVFSSILAFFMGVKTIKLFL